VVKQYIFPADKFINEMECGLIFKNHIHESTVQRAVKDAIKKHVILNPFKTSIVRLKKHGIKSRL